MFSEIISNTKYKGLFPCLRETFVLALVHATTFRERFTIPTFQYHYSHNATSPRIRFLELTGPDTKINLLRFSRHFPPVQSIARSRIGGRIWGRCLPAGTDIRFADLVPIIEEVVAHPQPNPQIKQISVQRRPWDEKSFKSPRRIIATGVGLVYVKYLNRYVYTICVLSRVELNSLKGRIAPEMWCRVFDPGGWLYFDLTSDLQNVPYY